MPPTPIIFDTDMSIDVDDVGALCMAHALADMKETEILAVVHNSASPEGAGAISVINRYHNRDHIPIGAYAGTIGDPNGTSRMSPWGFVRIPPQSPWQIGPYVPDLVRTFPGARVRNSSMADGDSVTVMRRALASAADRSVTIVSVGYATNLHDMLLSSGDGISPLAGPELVSAKVKQLVMMGGRRNHVEWNFAGAEANGISVCGGPSNSLRPGGCGAHNNLGRITNETLALWPARTSLVFVDFETGVNVWTGGVLASAAPASSPCRRAYQVFCSTNVGWCQPRAPHLSGPSRCSWDIQAVLFAVRGKEQYYELEQGQNFVDTITGLSRWVPLNMSSEAAAGAVDEVARLPRQFALVMPPSMIPELEHEISNLLAQPYPVSPLPPPPPPSPREPPELPPHPPPENPSPAPPLPSMPPPPQWPPAVPLPPSYVPLLSSLAVLRPLTPTTAEESTMTDAGTPPPVAVIIGAGLVILLFLNRALWKVVSYLEARGFTNRGEVRLSDAKMAGEAGIALRPYDSALQLAAVAEGELDLVSRMRDGNEDDDI